MLESFDRKIENLSNELKKRGWMLATAESCTGGMISSAITARPGCSSCFDRGFVTYSNESKQELLGVSREILEKNGAVSAECAEAMVKGALNNSRACTAVSVTGIAGPDGGSDDKPVGLVYLGWCRIDGNPVVRKFRFSGDRQAIRESAAQAAIDGLLELLDKSHV